MSAACSVGHLLLQPQRLPRLTATSAEDALLDDLLAAVLRISADRAMGGTIVDDLEDALEALAVRLLERAGGGLTRAVQHLQDVARPLGALADEIPGLFADADDPAAVAERVLGLLGGLAAATGRLTIDGVRDRTAAIVDVIQQDLGLTADALEHEFWALLDDVVARLEAAPAGLDAALRANRLAVAGVLRRIRRRLRGVIKIPDLSADRLASALFEEIERLIGPELAKVSCVGRAASDLIAAGRAVERVVPFTGFGSGSIGAADAESPPDEPRREYLWYPSWLLGDKDIAWYEIWRLPFPGDVWVDRRGTHTQIRFREDRLFLTDAFTWTDIPIGEDRYTYTFKHPSAEAMEYVAWHSAWAAEATEALFHIVSPLSGVTIRKGGQVSVTDLLDLIVGLGHTGLKAFGRMPFSFLVASGAWWGRPVSWSPTVAAHLAGSFQGWHSNATGGNKATYWALILVPSDVIRAVSANSLPSLAREALLSFLTLWNYDGPSEAPAGDDTRPQNRREMNGLLAIFQFLSSLLMVKTTYDRKYYGHPFTGNGGVSDFSVTVWVVYNLVLGTVFGLLGGFIGTAFNQGLMAILGSPATDWGLLGKNIGKSILKSVGLFWLNVYAFRENDTGGGTFNPGAGGDFAGYPSEDSSPYLLPWKQGDTYMCGQGNQGIFSHNNTNPGGSQVYAYDFMLDKGDEILASRGGTVVDFFDWAPDDDDVNTNAPAGATVSGQSTSDNWNFVAIRHDTADAAHDRGPGGGQVTTYGVYGHGLNGSVRSVFAARTPSVGAMNIIGTVVAQGEPIMLADDTGVSFCDHLHMQVEVGPAGTGGAAVARSMLGPTIPFVFKDGGQPGSRSWHESDNARKP